MQSTIRAMREQDSGQVLQMMRLFYASDAVWSNGSEAIFEADVDACVGETPYLEGYIFENEDALQGYAMVAKSFSTEFGKPCIWIEDIYIQDPYRGLGIGSQFFAYIEENTPMRCSAWRWRPKINGLCMYIKNAASM